MATTDEMHLWKLWSETEKIKEKLKELQQQMYDKNDRCEATKFVKGNPIAYTITCDDGYELEYKPEIKVIEGWRYVSIPSTRSVEAFRYAVRLCDAIKDKDTVRSFEIMTHNPEKFNSSNVYVQVRMLEDVP